MTAISQPLQTIKDDAQNHEPFEVGNVIYRFDVDFGPSATIPEEFDEALADLAAGRVTNLDTALNERPVLA